MQYPPSIAASDSNRTELFCCLCELVHTCDRALQPAQVHGLASATMIIAALINPTNPVWKSNQRDLQAAAPRLAPSAGELGQALAKPQRANLHARRIKPPVGSRRGRGD